MIFRVLLLTITCVAALPAADWNPGAAARYLDNRQQEWFAWKPAQTAAGTCISCHTGMTYLLARPALRRTLHEPAPTEWETRLLDRLRKEAGQERKGILQGVQTIFGAVFLAMENPGSEASKAAQRQLWELQRPDAEFQGVWQWYDAKLDPWETHGAFSYGAGLGALAAGLANAPSEKTKPMIAWLRENRATAPLHSQLSMLWASTKLAGLLSEAERKSLVTEIISKQSPDGSWTIASLGGWIPHPDAPPQPEGGHPYATAFTTFVLREAAGRPAAEAITKARAWLQSHQDTATGAWPAPSMNKKFPPDSMESKFMQDAATAFAVLALAD